MGLEVTPESELLSTFRETRDEAAFQELVRRHLGLVMQVALRCAGDRAVAEEIAQNLFVKLTRKASRLHSQTILAAWLHHVAVHETSDHHRRESRRRRTMQSFQNDPSTRQTTLASSTALASLAPEALDHLDRALERLSPPERAAIMLRFHSGLSFREIGQQSGKSEEACRKQVSRALGKLARWLGRSPARGSNASVPALAAALPSILGSHSPATPALVTSITTGALSAPTASLLSSLLISQTLIFMNAKSVLVLLAVLLAAFWTGHRTAASFDRRLVERSRQSAVDRATMTSSLAQESFATESSELPSTRTLEEIFQEALQLAKADGRSAHFHLRRLLAELRPEDYPEAIRLLEAADVSNRVFARLGSHLAGFWAYQDGDAAMDWVLNHLDSPGNSGVSRVLSAWSEVDPHAAYARYQALATEEGGSPGLRSFRWRAIGVFEGWAKHDPKGAVAALETVSTEDEEGALLGMAQAVTASPEPKPILEAVEATAPGPIRVRLIKRIADEWASEEPHAAAVWVDSLEGLRFEERLRIKGEVAENWLRYDRKDVAAIGAWFVAGAPATKRGELQKMIDRAVDQHSANPASH